MMRALLVCALLGAATQAGCARGDDAVVLPKLQAQLAQQYHACVPLGWNPVPAAGTYYPGTNVVLQEQGVWLPAMWIARINARGLHRPDVRAIREVLDKLAQLNLLSREPRGNSVTYRLSESGLTYFFYDSRYRNNRVRIPYLCYATMIPDRVLRRSVPRLEQLRDRPGETLTFRADYTWHASPPAPWARDPFIRSHSVMLVPTQSPAVATFVKDGDDWRIERLAAAEPGLGRIVDPSVWPSLHQMLTTGVPLLGRPVQ